MAEESTPGIPVKVRVYRGKITVRDYGESMDNLFVVDDAVDVYDQEPLAEQIADAIELFGPYLSVNYYITDEPYPQEDLQEQWLRHVLGDSDVKFHIAWSEITGYLWTDEDIMVGGHDLLAELVSNDGKFIHLEITYAEEPPA